MMYTQASLSLRKASDGHGDRETPWAGFASAGEQLWKGDAAQASGRATCMFLVNSPGGWACRALVGSSVGNKPNAGVGVVTVAAPEDRNRVPGRLRVAGGSLALSTRRG